MKTPSEIAQAAAKEIVTTTPSSTGEAYKTNIGDIVISHATYRDAERGAEYVANLREEIAPFIERAVETALRQCPVPAGMSDAKIEQVRILARQTLNPTDDNDWYHRRHAIAKMIESVSLLLGHIDHLHRIMHTDESEAIAEAYDAGYRAGYAGCGVDNGGN